MFGCYFKFGQTEKHFQLTEFESQNNGNDFPFLFSLQSTFGLGRERERERERHHRPPTSLAGAVAPISIAIDASRLRHHRLAR